MAALQERGGSYRVIFRHNGKYHTFTLGTVGQDEAESKAAQVDYLLMRLKQRLITLPEGTDIVTFIQHDGKPPDVPNLPDAPRKAVTIAHLKERFLVTFGNGTIEANSLDTCKLHLSHFCRFLGEAFPLGDLSTSRLQDYINRRSRQKISPVTIRKELATLRSAWNWGESLELTSGRFPNKGLRYPKQDEKPPFMTREQILRQIGAGGDADILWDALYLQTAELTELLDNVKIKDSYGWLYPLFVFAAHTGARRSEIIRVTVADVDLAANVVTIREKKRSRSERTTRRVPMTPLLCEVLRAWLKDHPGGPHLFCHRGEVARSKKRSRRTGFKGDMKRPTTLKGRLAAVKKRQLPGITALTRNEVHHHFKFVLKGSKWEMMRGLHCLRHSFISACASMGVDQRLIDEWSGHSTEQQRKRYRHLYPSTQQEAIKRVFG
jgi:integrase